MNTISTNLKFSFALNILLLIACAVIVAGRTSQRAAAQALSAQLQLATNQLSDSGARLEATLKLAADAQATREQTDKSLKEEMASFQKELEQVTKTRDAAQQASHNWRSNFYSLQIASSQNKKAQVIEAWRNYQMQQVELAARQRDDSMRMELHRAELMQKRVSMEAELRRSMGVQSAGSGILLNGGADMIRAIR